MSTASNNAPKNNAPKNNAAVAAVVVAVVVGMTGMAFAAVPLYEAFCRATGFGGTPRTAARAADAVLDRTVEIRFDTNVAPGLPVEFTAMQRTARLRIGETGLAFYRVRNTSDRPAPAIATYNVTPHVAGQHFVKLECFCFNERVLAPGEEVELPVVYFVDPAFASDPDTADVGAVTLSYTFFRSVDEAGSALADAGAGS